MGNESIGRINSIGEGAFINDGINIFLSVAGVSKLVKLGQVYVLINTENNPLVFVVGRERFFEKMRVIYTCADFSHNGTINKKIPLSAGFSLVTSVFIATSSKTANHPPPWANHSFYFLPVHIILVHLLRRHHLLVPVSSSRPACHNH